MKKYSCIIIEDEHLLAEVLEDYIHQVSFLELRSVFSDAIQALDYVHQHKVDLIFIDINLPKLKGIDFIKLVRDSSKFIITTAYHEFAIQGYELNVLDYLLKPIEFNRFLSAVHKLHPEGYTVPETKPLILDKDYLFVNINKRRVRINFNEIIYIEGMKEYVQIYLTDSTSVTTKLQLGQINELLNNEFLRIHKSYIVSKSKVTSYSLAEIHLGAVKLPVGINYKDSLVKALE
ncbi:MAG: LytTR family DNA-binding domain-containing protein [Saprospiraceae bacterium]